VFIIGPLLVILGLGIFILGTVVGSFINVCIYRIPWQKSVVWPGSRCPHCLRCIAARDNLPVIGWIALRGECRSCGAAISIRYPLVEALVGLLFLGLYLVDVIHAPRGVWNQIPWIALSRLAYHALLTSLLVIATFIDYDLFIIPDEVTVTGMVLGLTIGAAIPAIRLEPAGAATPLGGLAVGFLGLLVGAGLTEGVRRLASGLLGREAMGFGDVTLMGMIGAFLGWQAAVLTFFLAPFFGLAHAFWKLLAYLKKRATGREVSSADREIPFGPYLSMAAMTLMLSWPWLWAGWAKGLFATMGVIFWWLIGVDVKLPED
jgi:leader peptidase (prepilin peptidase)/N-methyltransferase